MVFILDGPSMALRDHVMENGHLTQALINASAENDKFAAERGYRLGFMGFVTDLANRINQVCFSGWIWFFFFP